MRAPDPGFVGRGLRADLILLVGIDLQPFEWHRTSLFSTGHSQFLSPPCRRRRGVQQG